MVLLPSPAFSEAQGQFSPLVSSLLDARARGWSVIPLIGGEELAYGKRPRLAWRSYASRHATKQELETWLQRPLSAYGLVCGALSRLLVLDFDETELQAEFFRRYPQLTKTYLVQSGFRKTLHFYFHVDFPVSSCKLRGGDLKGEGSYVLGAGSSIAGATWTCVQELPLYPLSQSELDAILQDFALVQSQSVHSHVEHADAAGVAAKSLEGFGALYQERCQRGSGRNTSLFVTACQMRDNFYSQAEVEVLLRPLHVAQPALSPQPLESAFQREREATASIASAFSRPPRAPKLAPLSSTEDCSRLSNTLRERLLKEPHGLAFLRVYEGLLLLDRGEEVLTETEMFKRLQTLGIGRHSLRLALRFRLDPSPRPSPMANAEMAVKQTDIKNCVFVPRTKSDKNRKGRPVQLYALPSPHALCRSLDLEAQEGDPIYLSDLGSVGAYRAALERELLRRRPQAYSLQWLGKRLSVSRRSIQRYHRSQGVQSRQILHETPLFWGNLNLIPRKDLAQGGGLPWRAYFLQDSLGKRYPALIGIAQRLLARGRSVSLMQRDVKQYWLGTESSSLQAPARSNIRVEAKQRIANLQDDAASSKQIHSPCTPVASTLFPGVRSSHPAKQESETNVALRAKALRVSSAKTACFLSKGALEGELSEAETLRIQAQQQPSSKASTSFSNFEGQAQLLPSFMNTPKVVVPRPSRTISNTPQLMEAFEFPTQKAVISSQDLPSSLKVSSDTKTPSISKAKLDSRASKGHSERGGLSFWEALPNSRDEWLAQKLYTAAENLRLQDARQLVQLYGQRIVGQALGRMLYLRERKRLVNAAGFLITSCRVFWYGTNGFAQAAPKFVYPKPGK